MTYPYTFGGDRTSEIREELGRIRRYVITEADWSCRYCGDLATDVAVVVPTILGGDPDDVDNLVASCRVCRKQADGLLQAAIVATAGAHTDELAARYADLLISAGRPTAPVVELVPAEIPGQLSIEEVV